MYESSINFHPYDISLLPILIIIPKIKNNQISLREFQFEG